MVRVHYSIAIYNNAVKRFRRQSCMKYFSQYKTKKLQAKRRGRASSDRVGEEKAGRRCLEILGRKKERDQEERKEVLEKK